MTRDGCCAGWPKPCPYHEGWLDGYEVGYADAEQAYRGGGLRPAAEEPAWSSAWTTGFDKGAEPEPAGPGT